MGGGSTRSDIRWVRLEEIGTEFFRGNGITREQITPDGFPCVRYGELYTTYNIWFDHCESHTRLEEITSPKFIKNGDILFVITGESVEDIATSCAYIGKEPCLVGGDLVVMRHNQNPRYLAYALSTTAAKMQKTKGKVKSKVVHTNVASIKEIVIPLPSCDEQERIANALDSFKGLLDSICNGLPAEIAARQKQYEYYRDKLLDFKEILT